MIEEERRIWVFPYVLFKKLLTFLEEDQIDLLVIEIWGHHARSAVDAIGMSRKFVFVQLLRRWNGYSIAVYVGIEPICCRTTSRAIKLVEAAMDGSVRNGTRIVDL